MTLASRAAGWSSRLAVTGGAQGARSVAIAYAWMESQVAGRAVTVDEVLNDQVNDYQADINDSLGL